MLFQLLLFSGIFVLAYVIFWYLFALLKRDFSIIDIGWGLGFVSLSWVLVFAGNTPDEPLLVGMISLWGLRLAWHIGRRNAKSGEDWRYKQWREDWGRLAPLYALVKVFLLQGLIMWIVALPISLSFAQTQCVIGITKYLGLAIFGIGFLIEANADAQLAQFKANKSGQQKYIDSGLWKYALHPNYFGEMLVWWGIFLFVLPQNYWYISLASPLCISLILIFISAPMLRRKYEDDPAYQAYKAKRNHFIPIPIRLF